MPNPYGAAKCRESMPAGPCPYPPVADGVCSFHRPVEFLIDDEDDDPAAGRGTADQPAAGKCLWSPDICVFDANHDGDCRIRTGGLIWEPNPDEVQPAAAAGTADGEPAPAAFGVPWHEIDPELRSLLVGMGNRWGPLGVALAAAHLTDPAVLVARLAAGGTRTTEPEPAAGRPAMGGRPGPTVGSALTPWQQEVMQRYLDATPWDYLSDIEKVLRAGRGAVKSWDAMDDVVLGPRRT